VGTLLSEMIRPLVSTQIAEADRVLSSIKAGLNRQSGAVRDACSFVSRTFMDLASLWRRHHEEMVELQKQWSDGLQEYRDDHREAQGQADVKLATQVETLKRSPDVESLDEDLVACCETLRLMEEDVCPLGLHAFYDKCSALNRSV
jgi:hypothetical protein